MGLKYNAGMAHSSKSQPRPFIAVALASAVAAAAGYAAVKFVAKRSSNESDHQEAEGKREIDHREAEGKREADHREAEEKKKSARTSKHSQEHSQKHSDISSGHARKKSPDTQENTSSKARSEPKGTVTWIPALRVREQKILNSMGVGERVTMSDITRMFPDVTRRTLRRDMDRLVEKGRVQRTGATRSTSYVRV